MTLINTGRPLRPQSPLLSFVFRRLLPSEEEQSLGMNDKSILLKIHPKMDREKEKSWDTEWFLS